MLNDDIGQFEIKLFDSNGCQSTGISRRRAPLTSLEDFVEDLLEFPGVQHLVGPGELGKQLSQEVAAVFHFLGDLETSVKLEPVSFH